MLSDRRIRTSVTALILDLVLTGFRVLLAWLTASVALTADALHSVSDVLVSFALLLSMVYRFKQEKTGCERKLARALKVEAMAVIAVALLILAVPFEIYQQTQSMRFGQIQNAWWGIAGIGAVMLVLMFSARLKMLVGIETDSEALKADSEHTKVDLLTSAAVMLSLVGSLIGFNLDEYVALLIAVMIFVTGVELLIRGIRSLSGHTDSEIHLVEWCFDKLKSWLPKLPFDRLVGSIISAVKVSWKPTLILVFVGYLVSGITIVPQGFVGAYSRFGKIIEQDITPGLVLALPAPIEKVTLLPEGRLYSVSIGSRNSFMRPSYGAKLWHSVKESQLSRENSDYLLTGDEKLVFFKADVQYRITEPSVELTQFSNVENLLKNISDAVLISHSTKYNFNQLQELGFSEYTHELEKGISDEAALFELPVEIVSVRVQQIEPPAYLVAKYRDALDAYQESQTLVNQANAWSMTEIPKARAEHFQVTANAKAEASQRTYSVEGETERFKFLAEVYNQSAEAYRFNQQVDVTQAALKGKPFTVIDPAFSSLDFRIWGGAGTRVNDFQTPLFNDVGNADSDSLLGGFDQAQLGSTTSKPTSGKPTQTSNQGDHEAYKDMSKAERNLDPGSRELLNGLRAFRTGQ